MTGIEPGSSCIVSNRSANCATATAWNGFIFNLRFASMDKLKAVSSIIALSINRSVNNQSGGGGLFTKTFVLSIGRFDEISFDEISLNKVSNNNFRILKKGDKPSAVGFTTKIVSSGNVSFRNYKRSSVTALKRLLCNVLQGTYIFRQRQLNEFCISRVAQFSDQECR